MFRMIRQSRPSRPQASLGIASFKTFAVSSFSLRFRSASHTVRRTSHYEILTGTPLVKFDCTICNKHYASASGLRRHNLKNHNETGVDLSVLCDICGKRLSSREKLKFHHRTHTGYKPYGCQICPKSFSKKEQLIEHVRVHTGEKPYICKYCGRGFTQRTPLRIHERTHTGERPNICPICGKGFISKTALESHIRSCYNTPQPLIQGPLQYPYYPYNASTPMAPMTPSSVHSEAEAKYSLTESEAKYAALMEAEAKLSLPLQDPEAKYSLTEAFMAPQRSTNVEQPT
ncbi:unnamed protein product [Callosobruchus maculatus]|uniref:C2H2-type domain-containing protein n=1 Tax=Callosobruchus maculatus TaxID=64391 RepID=A0A653DJY2_CALMS|nr:unnamed protein product [Callosobruchus maculatus]